MGMDVYGENPTSEVGSYFRRNVWGWHPLWEYCCTLDPDLSEKVPYGHSNDGDGLDKSDSIVLSVIIDNSVKTGFAEKYVKERNELLEKIPDNPCRLCNSTGIRTDDVGIKMEMDKKKWCNGCDGTGYQKSIECSYYLGVEDITDFSTFLRECGGFSIC